MSCRLFWRVVRLTYPWLPLALTLWHIASSTDRHCQRAQVHFWKLYIQSYRLCDHTCGCDRPDPARIVELVHISNLSLRCRFADALMNASAIPLKQNMITTAVLLIKSIYFICIHPFKMLLSPFTEGLKNRYEGFAIVCKGILNFWRHRG